MRVSRERVAAAVAVGAHALAVVVVSRLSPLASTYANRTPSSLEAIAAIEIDPVPAVEQPPRLPLPPTTDSARLPAEPPAQGGIRHADPPQADGRAATPDVETVAQGGSWTFNATKASVPIDISLGDGRYKVAVGETAPAENPTRPPPMFGERSAHDLSLGLGRGGAVRSAVEEAAEASESKPLGVAVFDVTLDRKGAVRVDVVEANGGEVSWGDLRDAIAGRVADKSVPLPDGHGLRVRVRVEAANKLADGRDVRSLGNGMAASPGAPGAESVAMKDMPHLGFEHRGKICTARVAIGPTGGDLAAQTDFGVDSPGVGSGLPSLLTPLTIGGGCSPENIGLPPRRMVAARVVSETVL